MPLKKNMLFHMWLVLVILYIYVWSKSMAIFKGYGEFRKCWLMHRSRSLGEGLWWFFPPWVIAYFLCFLAYHDRKTLHYIFPLPRTVLSLPYDERMESL